MRRVKISVTGKVQGVFFRVMTKDLAKELGIVGTIKNDLDDSVNVIAQGDEESIEKMIVWCKHGPPNSKIENVDVEELQPSDEFDDFKVVA